MLTKLRKLKSRPGFYLMKAAARFETVRWSVVHMSPYGPRPSPGSSQDTVFSGLNPNTAIEHLREDGIAVDVNLPTNVTTEIYRYAMTHPCYGNYEPHNGFYVSQLQKAELAAISRFATASYYNTSQCPAIKQLTSDPKLWEIAGSYLGTTPYYLGTSMWWSFPGERTQAEQNYFAQKFHFDLDDYKFLKFFFYITDVDEGAGPHVFVSGSHKQKRWNWRMRIRRHADETIRDFYGEQNVLTLTGKGGTGFAEDTYGMHKGTSPTHKPRLILQLQFGLFDYGVQHDDRDPQALRQVA